jgi:hypothetical protein
MHRRKFRITPSSTENNGVRQEASFLSFTTRLALPSTSLPPHFTKIQMKNTFLIQRSTSTAYKTCIGGNSELRPLTQKQQHRTKSFNGQLQHKNNIDIDSHPPHCAKIKLKIALLCAKKY